MENITTREAAFSIPDVVKTALDRGLKGVTPEHVDRRVSELIRAEQLIPGKQDRIDGVVTHVTTPEALATERGIPTFVVQPSDFADRAAWGDAPPSEPR